jgi:hypothetical protein
MNIIVSKTRRSREQHINVSWPNKGLKSYFLRQITLLYSAASSGTGWWDSIITQGRAVLQQVSTATGVNSNRIHENVVASRNVLHTAVITARTQVDQVKTCPFPSPDGSEPSS